MLAALNFAFSQGSDSGSDSTVDQGEAVIATSDIIRYAGTVEQTVRDLQRREGCSENDLSFSRSSGDAYDHDAPNRCKVFNFEGGGLNYDAPKDEWTGTNDPDWYFPDNVAIKEVGTDSEDLVIMLQDMKSNICKQINNKLNIDSGTPPPQHSWSEDGTLDNYYTGSFTGGDDIDAVTGRR